jgi:hypothetical protein
MLHLGEDLGVGLRDLAKNDISGVPISEVRFDYNAVREKILADRKKA